GSEPSPRQESGARRDRRRSSGRLNQSNVTLRWPRLDGSVVIAISTIFPDTTLKARIERRWPAGAQAAPARPSMRAGLAAWARPENVFATAVAPRISAA